MARKPFQQMTPVEVLAWMGETRSALERKQKRERAYLARRAARGVHTATDKAYEQDQILEADLLWLLDEMEQDMRALEEP